MSPAGVLFVTFGALLLLGAPITVALGAAAMATLYAVDQNLVTMVQIAFTSVNSFPIMALPAFVLTGALMEHAGISRRLVAIAEQVVGPIPGGLAVSTALACVFYPLKWRHCAACTILHCCRRHGSGNAGVTAMRKRMMSRRATRRRPPQRPGAWGSSFPRAFRWSSTACQASSPSPSCSSPGWSPAC